MAPIEAFDILITYDGDADRAQEIEIQYIKIDFYDDKHPNSMKSRQNNKLNLSIEKAIKSKPTVLRSPLAIILRNIQNDDAVIYPEKTTEGIF